jgi:hypothetical protein
MDSSVLILSVKHHTSKPVIKDSLVGSSEIVLNRLLQMCEDNQHRSLIISGLRQDSSYYKDTTSELRLKIGKLGYARKDFITIRLNTTEPTRAGKIARINTHEDIEHSGISKSAAATADSRRSQGMDPAIGVVREPGSLETALWSVVSKLNVFINIIDKASQVSVRKSHSSCYS